MARKRQSVKTNPDYYLNGRERRVRRESWEWPDSERHPVVGVNRAPYSDGWYAYIGNGQMGFLNRYFPDATYGGPREALEAAKEWRQEQVKRRGPRFKSCGWKLGPEHAGAVFVEESRGAVCAYLAHDGARCRQSFAFRKYGGKERAIMLAELALEVWREEAKRISLMPRREQERIARRGGWTSRKGFPRTREQMDLPLDRQGQP